jgi:hypothetical protein
MEPLIITAIIAATATVTAGVTVAIINLNGGRVNERKKLRDQIRLAEYSQRLQTLLNIIELIQRLKNIIKYFLNDQVITIDKQWAPYNFNPLMSELKDIRDEFDLLYARGVANLNEEEGQYTHDLVRVILDINNNFSSIAKKTDQTQLIDPKYLERISSEREKLSEFQEKYLVIRRGLIKKANID